jgi:hypothetical protein
MFLFVFSTSLAIFFGIMVVAGLFAEEGGVFVIYSILFCFALAVSVDCYNGVVVEKHNLKMLILKEENDELARKVELMGKIEVLEKGE